MGTTNLQLLRFSSLGSGGAMPMRLMVFTADWSWSGLRELRYLL